MSQPRSMQHAISRLAEERRILSDIYRRTQRDGELTGAQRGQYLSQLAREMREVTNALAMLRAADEVPVYQVPLRVLAWERNLLMSLGLPSSRTEAGL